jgi:hypothetical protein
MSSLGTPREFVGHQKQETIRIIKPGIRQGVLSVSSEEYPYVLIHTYWLVLLQYERYIVWIRMVNNVLPGSPAHSMDIMYVVPVW